MRLSFLRVMALAIVAGIVTWPTVMFADGHAKTKVGFIYVGPIGDGGWTYEHDKGRLAVEAEFGDKVETVYQESVPEGADAERAITQMALQGADIIFTTSFGYMDPTNAGYIASFPIPEVIRGINSAYIHAKKVNPDVEFNIIWAYTWFDPAKEADAATALIEQGADVILQHTDSTAPQAAAQKAGNVITFGQASDMIEYAPYPRVSSIIDDWAPYYISRVKAVMDGTWESTDTWDGIGAGMVAIGDISDAVPKHVQTAALLLKAQLADGSYHAFTGPINKQDGSVWLVEGETASDGDLAGMNFYVEGITAEIPN